MHINAHQFALFKPIENEISSIQIIKIDPVSQKAREDSAAWLRSRAGKKSEDT
jgi:hypothetical protein